MREIPAFVRLQSAAVPLGLLCVSLACLFAGGLLARALGETGLPRSGAP